MLTDLDLFELSKFRRELHQYPELSGYELETSKKILTALEEMRPSQIIDKIGGYGLAAIFDSQKKICKKGLFLRIFFFFYFR